MRGDKILRKKILVALFIGLIFLLICDQVLRRVLPPVYQVTELGWSLPPTLKDRRTVEDSPGKFREVTAHWSANGFKRWGDVHTKKTKMLILGDSFTFSSAVSDGEEWYAFLEKAFGNLELFVCGVPGYGSLQEFMMLDKFIDEIRPQAVLIQFCDNDFMDNLHALERLYYPLSNIGFRPYLESDQIVYKMPVPFSGLRRHSFLADRVLAIYDRHIRKQATKDIDAFSRKKNSKKKGNRGSKSVQKLREEAFEVTNRIYTKIKKRIGNKAIFYLFDMDDDPRLEDLCKANGIHYISGVKGALSAKVKEGFPVYLVNDNHWNRLGNKVVGEKLVEYFKGQNLLDVSRHFPEEKE